MSQESALAALDGERRRFAAARRSGAPARRPRDAGTLLVVDTSGAVPKLLMGRRAAGHVFMPGHYVFPGGRVDRSDLSLAKDFSLEAGALDRLTNGSPARFGARQAVATALAAIRETYEEVGAMIGRPGSFTGGPGFWSAFAEAEIRPAPERLVPLARAITPPGAPRRFDARFFAIDASDIDAAMPERPPTDEFDAVEWVALDRTGDLHLAAITVRVLEELGARLADGSWRDPSRPIPFYRVVNGRFTCEYL
ncbi:NUDIX hydrolase [Jiella sp. M17.18]|uniref:NUDIX hydrolase n=1 Tax=Jiella sp. M17.18 TaxID=3234247 RepID=UPI0034DEFD36